MSRRADDGPADVGREAHGAHDKEQGFRLVERLRAIAASHEASVAQVAIAWLLSKRAVTTVLLGASKLSQLEDNIGAADV